MSLVGLKPGDVCAVDGDAWWNPFGAAIRFGGLLAHHYTWCDHIIVVHHTDAAGVLWGVEGRPGGVGWAPLAQYDNRWLRSNRAEYKTPDQRMRICERMEKLLGVGYDWLAIAEDAEIDATGGDASCRARTIARLYDPVGQIPQHVVCSSAAAWAYEDSGLSSPPLAYRLCQPWNWWALFNEMGWK